jgi:hypothetical protein
LPFPETYPVIGRLVIDPLNYLWVREYASPESAAQQWWHIHDSDGQWVGRIAFASDLAVFEIGIDYVLGLTHNEDGVETVRLFALDRRPGLINSD